MVPSDRGRSVYMFLLEIDPRQNKCKCSEHVLEIRSHVRLYKGCIWTYHCTDVVADVHAEDLDMFGTGIIIRT